MTRLRRLSTAGGLTALALAVGTCSEATGPGTVITEITLELHSVAVARGDSVTLFVSGRDAQGLTLNRPPVSWTSRDQSVVRVHSLGSPAWIIPVRVGQTIVVAASGQARDSATVLVTLPRVTRITPAFDTLRSLGASVDLRALASDSAGPVLGSFSWRSRDPSVAQVSQTGRSVAQGDGATYIVALEQLGSRDSAFIVVHRPVARITVTPNAYGLPLQRRLAFLASARDADTLPLPTTQFTWSSSNPSLATVDSTGVVTAVGVGVDTIRAMAEGISGIAVLTTRGLPALRFNVDTIYTGVGLILTGFGRPMPQLIPDLADTAYNPTIIAGVTNSDTSVASAPATLVVQGYDPGLWNLVVGKRPGLTRLTASAPGYTPGSVVIRVTTPRLKAESDSTSVSVEIGQGPGTGVVIADSLGDLRRVARSTLVQVRSSDTTVLQAAPESVVFAPSDLRGSTAAIGKTLGTARLYFTAQGYLPDSASFHVVPARLHFVATNLAPLDRYTLGVGLDNSDNPAHVSTLGPLSDTIRVTLTQRHPEVVNAPASVLLPSNDIRLVGVASGADTIVATRPGYLPDTLVVQVTPPTFVVRGLPTSDYVTTVHPIEIFVADSYGVVHFPAAGDVTVQLGSSDTAAVRWDAGTATIGRSTGGGLGSAYFAGPGAATLTFTAGGFLTVAGSMTASPVPLTMRARGGRYEGTRSVALGMRQALAFSDNLALVQYATPVGYGARPVSVRLRSTNSRVAVPAVSEFTPGNSTSGVSLFDIVGGDSTGAVWIVAEGRGLIPDSLQVVVGRPYFVFTSDLQGLETGKGTLEIQIRDQAGNLRVAAEPTPIALSSTDPAIVVPDSAQVTIPAGGYSALIPVHFRSPGTAAIVAIDARPAALYDPGASGPIQVGAVQTP